MGHTWSAWAFGLRELALLCAGSESLIECSIECGFTLADAIVGANVLLDGLSAMKCQIRYIEQAAAMRIAPRMMKLT